MGLICTIELFYFVSQIAEACLISFFRSLKEILKIMFTRFITGKTFAECMLEKQQALPLVPASCGTSQSTCLLAKLDSLFELNYDDLVTAIEGLGLDRRNLLKLKTHECDVLINIAASCENEDPPSDVALKAMQNVHKMTELMSGRQEGRIDTATYEKDMKTLMKNENTEVNDEFLNALKSAFYFTYLAEGDTSNRGEQEKSSKGINQICIQPGAKKISKLPIQRLHRTSYSFFYYNFDYYSNIFKRLFRLMELMGWETRDDLLDRRKAYELKTTAEKTLGFTPKCM